MLTNEIGWYWEIKHVNSQRGTGYLWEEMTFKDWSKWYPGARHGNIWRKNIRGEGRFPEALRLNVQKQKEAAACRKSGESSVWEGWRHRSGPYLYRVLPCNQRKEFQFYSRFSEKLSDRFYHGNDMICWIVLRSLSLLPLCGRSLASWSPIPFLYSPSCVIGYTNFLEQLYQNVINSVV